MEILTSRNNPAVKAAASLKESSNRRKTGLFLIEGARLCCDAAKNGVEITEFFITEKAAEKYKEEYLTIKESAAKTYFVAESVAEKLSDTKNSQQLFAVCRENKVHAQINYEGIYIFTDDIQNPDNLGAVVRTAEALGADGIIVNSGCDIYSPKALRASMGGLLRFSVIKTDNGSELLPLLSKNGMKIYASVVDGTALDVSKVNEKGGTVLIIGNEGNGVSEEILALCTEKVTIPMKGKAESLNASAAATILIWEFMKNR